MSETTSPLEQLPSQHAYTWVPYLPEGAVSVDSEGPAWVLRASQPLQGRFEALLARRKAGTLSPAAVREYEAIGDLETALRWLNRLACGARTAGGRHGGGPSHTAGGARTSAAPL
jgi:hypothetical protein